MDPSAKAEMHICGYNLVTGKSKSGLGLAHLTAIFVLTPHSAVQEQRSWPTPLNSSEPLYNGSGNAHLGDQRASHPLRLGMSRSPVGPVRDQDQTGTGPNCMGPRSGPGTVLDRTNVEEGEG